MSFLGIFLRVLAAVWLIADVGPIQAAEIPLSERHPGYDNMSRETRAMQDDDTANPATLWILDGESLWNEKMGAAQKACADCHGNVADKMKGVAARYPAFNERLGKVIDLEARVNMCHTGLQKATPFTFESKELLALTALVARQSRGAQIAPDDNKLATTIEAGREIYYRRQGQLNLSCANCHNDNWDRKLAGSAVTQGHPTGYPLYRMEWQALGSLQRRLRNCMIGMRAEPYELGSPEFIALEAFLMWRARSMKMDAPAVRP